MTEQSGKPGDGGHVPGLDDNLGRGIRTAVVDGIKRTIRGHQVTASSAVIDFLGAAIEQPVEDQLTTAGMSSDGADLVAKGARHLIANLDYGRAVLGVAVLEIASRELQEAFIASAADLTPESEAEWHLGAAVHALVGFARRFVVDTILTGNVHLAFATGLIEGAILLRDYHLSVPFPQPARLSPQMRVVPREWSNLGARALPLGQQPG